MSTAENPTQATKATSTIKVEVAYARPDKQVIIPLMVENGCTVEEAVKQSGILDKFPEIDAEKLDLGIFGKATRANTVLRELDRVEIYRPLIADPKEVRRKRAEDGKQMKKGGA